MSQKKINPHSYLSAALHLLTCIPRIYTAKRAVQKDEGSGTVFVGLFLPVTLKAKPNFNHEEKIST